MIIALFWDSLLMSLKLFDCLLCATLSLGMGQNVKLDMISGRFQELIPPQETDVS